MVIGKQILNALCDEASRCGAKEFRGGHRMKNIASAKMFESCGFKYAFDTEEKTDPRTGEKYVIRKLKKELR
jgi:L-amino acid N-acyltransferase YncA